MKFAEQLGETIYLISGYEHGAIRVQLPAGPGGISYEPQPVRSSFLITPERVVLDWPPEDIEALRDEHLDAVLELNPQVVIIGTGNRNRMPPTEVLLPLIRAGIGWEVMDTPAACRTYNLLVGEARSVVAALFPID